MRADRMRVAVVLALALAAAAAAGAEPQPESEEAREEAAEKASDGTPTRMRLLLRDVPPVSQSIETDNALPGIDLLGSGYDVAKGAHAARAGAAGCAAIG